MPEAYGLVRLRQHDNGDGESNGDTAIQWADDAGPQQGWWLRRVG